MDIVNQIGSFFDKILIDKNYVLIFLISGMVIISVFITTYLWEKSKEMETSRLQKIKFIRSFILMVLSFVVIIFSYIGISDFYIDSNLITETDEVVLVEKGIKDIKVNSEDGYPLFATGGFKLIGKRGYAVNYFKGKPFFNQAFFNKNSLKGTIVNVDNDVYNNLKSDKDPQKIKFKYYFYKKGSGNPRIIVVESK
jgi:hypothetical protein